MVSEGKTLGGKLRWGLRVFRQVVVELWRGQGARPPTMDTAPVVPIADLRAGQVFKVVGKVRCYDKPELFAPLSGRRCAFYRTKLLEADKQNVLEETGSQSFFIVDDSAEALVIVEQAEVVVAMDANVSWGLFDKLSESAKEFLARHGRKSHNSLLRRDIQFEEGLIEPGETVAVFGHARPAQGNAAIFSGYRT
ncbi:MAG: hypothetical protein JRI68_21815, partial [Deltaproteobacteria bacterium]|nr:hypothetical protein [Deltaproteobacteria bacterium]